MKNTVLALCLLLMLFAPQTVWAQTPKPQMPEQGFQQIVQSLVETSPTPSPSTVTPLETVALADYSWLGWVGLFVIAGGLLMCALAWSIPMLHKFWLNFFSNSPEVFAAQAEPTVVQIAQNNQLESHTQYEWTTRENVLPFTKHLIDRLETDKQYLPDIRQIYQYASIYNQTPRDDIKPLLEMCGTRLVKVLTGHDNRLVQERNLYCQVFRILIDYQLFSAENIEVVNLQAQQIFFSLLTTRKSQPKQSSAN